MKYHYSISIVSMLLACSLSTRLARAESLKRSLAAMADQIVSELDTRDIARAGVLEFKVRNPSQQESLGGACGQVGQYCAALLEEQIALKESGRIQLIDRGVLLVALRKQDFQITDLTSKIAVRGLGVELKGAPAVIVGTITGRQRSLIHYECQIFSSLTGEALHTIRGSAELNESEWAMLGVSVQVSAVERRPPRHIPGRPSPSATDVLISRLDRHSQGTHPLAEQDFPVRLSIHAGRDRSTLQERSPVFDGNRMYVALKPGELFEIWLENRKQRPFYLRLLVDGKNTLPEQVRRRGVNVEQKTIFRQAMVVNLAEARAWRLEPAELDQGAMVPREYVIPGFIKETGEQGKVNAFRTADLSPTPDQRIRYGSQLGVITAGIYLSIPRDSTRQLQTILGETYDQQTEMYYGNEVPGNMLGIIHIHYVTPETLKAIQEERQRP